MTLIATFLILFSIIGWASVLSYAHNAALTLPQAVFSVMAAMGSFMMMAFILNISNISAHIIIYGGWVAWAGYLIMKGYDNGFKAILSQYRILFLSLVVALIAIISMAWGLQFGSIDEYSFWGTISRFLFVFNHLPDNAYYIKASFLQYTPGLASFHYLLYQLAGVYSPTLNYIAQDLILLAPLLLFIDEKQPTRSLVVIMTIMITMYLAYGNVLAKLEVDATVALWFFVLLWTATRTLQPSMWVMFFGLIFLSITKEIGLLFAVVVIVVHYVCHRKNSQQLTRMAILLAGVMCMKVAWLYHVHQYGFASFAAQITPSKALAALLPGQPEYVKSQLLFIKGLLLGNFDHLIRMPFVVIFAFAGWLIYRLRDQERFQANDLILMKAFGIVLPFYAINIYWLQAIVFRVGYQQTHLLDFPRYFNMAFVPFILSVLLIAVETSLTTLSQQKIRQCATALSMVALVFIVGGKVERMKKYYHPFDYNQLVTTIQKQVANAEQSELVCLTHVPEPDYRVLMPLQYRLLPRQVVNLDHHQAKNCAQTFDLASISR